MTTISTEPYRQHRLETAINIAHVPEYVASDAWPPNTRNTTVMRELAEYFGRLDYDELQDQAEDCSQEYQELADQPGHATIAQLDLSQRANAIIDFFHWTHTGDIQRRRHAADSQEMSGFPESYRAAVTTTVAASMDLCANQLAAGGMTFLSKVAQEYAAPNGVATPAHYRAIFDLAYCQNQMPRDPMSAYRDLCQLRHSMSLTDDVTSRVHAETGDFYRKLHNAADAQFEAMHQLDQARLMEQCSQLLYNTDPDTASLARHFANTLRDSGAHIPFWPGPRSILDQLHFQLYDAMPGDLGQYRQMARLGGMHINNVPAFLAACHRDLRHQAANIVPPQSARVDREHTAAIRLTNAAGDQLDIRWSRKTHANRWVVSNAAAQRYTALTFADALQFAQNWFDGKNAG